MNPPPSESHQVLDELRRLERRIVDLRRQLDGSTSPLPDGTVTVLGVAVAETWYGLPVAALEEAVQALRPTPLPEAPDWVLGSFRYGGAVCPLVDLRRRLTGAASTLQPEQQIVIAAGDPPCGFLVDALGDVTDLAPEQLAAPAADIPQSPYLWATVHGGAGAVRYLLDLDRLRRDTLATVDAPAEEPA